MRSTILFKIMIPLMSLSLIGMGTMQTAAGAVVNTETAMQIEHRSANIERINRALSRADVSKQLAALGVNVTDVQQRVAALSDSELQSLDSRIKELPAGGDVLAVLGILLVVLLVLELLGVTDVFKAI